MDVQITSHASIHGATLPQAFFSVHLRVDPPLTNLCLFFFSFHASLIHPLSNFHHKPMFSLHMWCTLVTLFLSEKGVGSHQHAANSWQLAHSVTLSVCHWIAGAVAVAYVAPSAVNRCCQMSLAVASSTNVIGVRGPRSYVSHAVRVTRTSTKSNIEKLRTGCSVLQAQRVQTLPPTKLLSCPKQFEELRRMAAHAEQDYFERFFERCNTFGACL